MPNILALLKKPTNSLFLLVVGLSFLLYLYSMSTHALGYADADELLTTGSLFGVTHPSGYPLATIVLGILFRLLPINNPVIIANSLAALLHALSIGILFLILLEIFKQIKRTSPPLSLWHYLLAAGGSLIASVTALIWLYGAVLEVVAFTTFFTGLITYSALRWYAAITSNTSSKSWFILTWALAGIGLAHVHTLVLLLPPLLILLIIAWPEIKQVNWYRRPLTWILAVTAAIAAFVSLNLLLLLLNNNQADVSWYFDQGLAGVWHHVSRADYTGNFVEVDKTRPAYFTGFNSLYLTTQPTYFTSLYHHFGPLAFLLSIIGFIYLLISKSKIKWFIISLFVFAGMILAGRLGYYPLDEYGAPQSLFTGVLHRQYVFGEYIAASFIGIGLLAIYTYLSQKTNTKKADIAGLIIISTTLFATTAHNASSAIQTQNHFISSYAQHMLAAAKPNSVIICSSDIACYSLLYESFVKNTRPDVTVLTKSTRYQSYFLQENQDYYQMTYNENPDFYSNLIAYNLQFRPVYITTPTDFYIDYTGLNGDPFYLVPTGYMFEVVTQPSQANFPEQDYQLSSQLIKYQFGPNDEFGQGLKHFFSALHNTMADIYSQYNQDDLALENYQLAMSLKPEFSQPQQKIAGLPHYLGHPRYQVEQASTSAQLASQADVILKQNQYQDAYNLLRKATYIDPTNADIRLKVTQLLLQGQYYTEAYRELEQILISHPDHTQAKEIMDSIQAQVDYSRLN